ncbi:MAG: serine hydrolase [Planctomycetota bacterium]
MLTSALLFSLVTVHPATAGGDEPSLEERLAHLEETLEEARIEANIPGMSLAVVHEDRIVLARGFGLANVEDGRVADEETIYAVGSTTKAFTAALVGILVDEGRATWDDPVTDYLPYFDLHVRSDDENARCTLRDLLSHRHGFSRMTTLWLSPEVSREEILRTAAGAEPWDDFREDFHYCNVTYLAAGEAAAVAAEKSWEELMEERLLEPLGMKASTLSAADALADPRLAVGYAWEESESSWTPKRMVPLDNIGPAGSLNANVLDMAQWVRLQLAEGKYGGERLIDRERVLETWSPQISIAGDVSYGLGWMLHEHDGHRVVEHGGNIGGFSAQVGLFPDADLGYVLLMNLTGAPLQQTSIPMVIESLLGELPQDESAAVEAAAADAGEASADEPLDLEPFLGTYIANFATFRDERFEVLREGDGLALDIPSQMVYGLKEPDAEGMWYFALTNQIGVTFQRDEAGTVTGLVVHQSGFEFEVPREGLVREPEVPLEQLERYVGAYVHEGGKRVEVVIEQSGLAFVNGDELLPLHAPDEDGYAPMRAREEIAVTFQSDAAGAVEALLFHRLSGKTRLFWREESADRGDLPSLDELLRLRNTDARVAARKGGVRMSGEVWFAQAGLRGRVEMLSVGNDRHAMRLDLGKFGSIGTAVDSGRGWRYDSLEGSRELYGKELAQTILDHPASVDGDWMEFFKEARVMRRGEVDGRPAYVVRLVAEDLPSREYWVDAENGDVVRIRQTLIEGPMRLPMTVHNRDFVELDGVRRPMTVEIENPETGRMVFTLSEREVGLELEDDAFGPIGPLPAVESDQR